MQVCRRSLLMIWLSILLAACQNSSSLVTAVPTYRLEIEERVIYRKVVAEIYSGQGDFLVFKTTTPANPKDSNLLQLNGIEEETLVDFFARNENEHVFDKDIQLHADTIFINLKELRGRFENNDPQSMFELDFVTLRESYPNMIGILEFSRVGFNVHANQALAKIIFYASGGHVAEYHYVLLLKHEKIWTIQDWYWLKVES